MRILMVTAELAPLIQAGGLGDAVSGLARALGARGHDVLIVVPAYRDALRHPACPDLFRAHTVEVDFGMGSIHGRWLRGELFAGVRLAMLDIPGLYGREGLYGDRHGGFGDNGFRFMTLSRAAAYLAELERPHVLVSHDHHAALAIGFLRTTLARGTNVGIGTVQVVHNNAYQGLQPPDDFRFTGLPKELFHPQGVEGFGALNLLKSGVGFADRIIAVSPTYAREIQTDACGHGLQGVYASRGHRLVGIPNGIDIARYDPACDEALVARYSAEHPEGKAKVKTALLEELHLAPPEGGLLCAAIGRLAAQKGWDVLAHSLDLLVGRGASVALLGDGDPQLADLIRAASRRHPGRVAARFGFDDGLARRMYAGADCVLVPSRFEPCGLVQRIAHRYGTIPVAHATGGLVDTIVDPAFDLTKKGQPQTGVLFGPLAPHALAHGVSRAQEMLDEVGPTEVHKRLMGIDVSWAGPARTYEAVLQAAAEEGRSRL